ncbi:uncharacterized protein LOC103703834 isoform X7 [Phoenix dactylifera]|uniref:Uncharacterized protein LOC103703834 isoform X7 n=1 Tax=Phoenix dactylifera TaxID=42345 RepID=A0A8B8J2Z4_PHODC|nr:uncharacterized protein LOC103703834 isoform X7 [Phoenix dactylifera]
MNCISYVSSAALFSHGSRVIMRSSLYGFSSTSWKSSIRHAGIKVLKLDFILMGFRVQCFSARHSKRLRLPEVKPQPSMEEESNAFYVVRKGDIIGLYNSLSDCQAQVSLLVSDPSVSVYKGYSLHKETEEYLASRGLKNALYSMNAADLKDDLFGTLTPCPFRFDGASKGNPGKAGAGAVLRTEDGTVVSRLREGLGDATCNVAEYRALILGLKYALKKGFKQIHVQGDSKLICMQVQDLWKTKNQNLADLYKEVKELKDMFLSFKIGHVKREFNSDADTQAKLAADLPIGKVCEDPGELFYVPIGKVCEEPDELH